MNGGWNELHEAEQMEELRFENAMAEAEEHGEPIAPRSSPDYGAAIEEARRHQPQEPQHYQQEQYTPEAQQHLGYQQIADVDQDPIQHFSDRMQQMEGHAQQRIFWDHVTASEEALRNDVGPDYDRACEHLENGRRAELAKYFPDNNQTAILAKQYGFNHPAQFREALLNRDRINVAQHAMQTGTPPAVLYYRLAQERGYKSNAPMPRSAMRQLAALADHDPDNFDQVWEKLVDQGRL